MGFFSWKCAKSDAPVMADMGVQGTPYDFSSKVVVLFKNGDRITGTYDGYGRVNGVELVDYPEEYWRMVIERYYNGESFDQLPKNKYDPGQGWFYDDAELEEFFNKTSV